MISSAEQETRGVLYVAAGRDHIRRALRAAASVRRHNPSLAIHLFADWEAHGFDFGGKPGPFTSWENITDPHRRSKVDYLPETPFVRTLYLDTDTRVLCPLDDLFRLLDRFDIGLAHGPKRARGEMLSPIRIPVPAAFGRFNGGVILYRSNEATLALLREWQVWFHEENLRWDQRTLREVLWASDIRLATLPPEYNIRRFKYVLFWSRDEARPKILHLHYFKRGLWTYVEQWWGTVMRRTRRRLGRLRAGMSHGR